MKPWRKLRPPTGPISPAQNAPASGTGPSSSSTTPASWSGSGNRRAAAVAREQQRGVAATPAEQRAQVLVGGVRVAHLELHGLADVDAVADRDRTGAAVGAEHVAHEEVAAVEVELVLVDDDPEVQALAHQLAVRFGRGLHDLLQPRHRGLAGELVARGCARRR